MKYLVIGAGGTGGMLAFALAKHHKDVTVIARNQHLQAIQEHGLTVERTYMNMVETVSVQATDMDRYDDVPDIIFVCVKYYSLDACVPFIKRVAGKQTIVIPILNVFSTGMTLQEQLPELLVTDGCIYISSFIDRPGVLKQTGAIFRVIFGVREAKDARPELDIVAKDLCECGIDSHVSNEIQREALEKFSYVSPIGAAGVYLNAKAGDFQKEGDARELFKQMIREVMDLAAAMGHPFKEDYVERNLKILDGIAPESTTSMQRDILAHRQSEFDGLVNEIVRLGERYGVDVPGYKMISDALKDEIV
ncbi:MAG: 2-dehydropantoate 2-reductase [Erysipelotrichaceae bacterium]|nr:2-dehydropantoate 2-reductase [Erysipelotrichaceae bacterium]